MDENSNDSFKFVSIDINLHRKWAHIPNALLENEVKK